MLVVMAGAIQRVIQTCTQAARDGYVTPRKWVPVAAVDCCCRRRRPREGEKFDDLSAIQWQIQNSGILNHLAHAHTACLHQSGVGLYLYLLTHLSHFEHRVNDRTSVNLQ